MAELLRYQNLVATTLAGLEEVCARELELLGAARVNVLKRAVRFDGSKEMLYRANYCSRTALRILVPLADYAVKDVDEYYTVINGYAWERIISCDKTLAIDVVGSHPTFTNTMFAAQKAKDGIVDRFRKLFERRPGVDLDAPDIRIHIHLQRERITVSLDSSGEPLFKRGYRKGSVPAPLNEVLAAGLISLSGWDMKTPFFDPFCGSGTIPIEAALMSAQSPAGKFRQFWGLMRWSDFDPTLWKQIQTEALQKECASDVSIYASDIDVKNLNIARGNMEEAGVLSRIQTKMADFNQYEFPSEPGFILANPPYGERLRPFDMITLYKSIGDTLKRRCPGYTAWLIGSDPETMKFIGLKPDRKITVFNGPLECKFLKFSLYAGTKRG
jgi:putative N6-adenine-specific DNA methylase